MLQSTFGQLFNDDQFLVTSFGADRNYESSAGVELIGDVVGGCGGDDRVEGCVFGPAFVPVAYFHLDIFVVEVGEQFLCPNSECWDNFD